MTDTMRALLVHAPGGPEQLYLGEAERPAPGAEEVLVRIHATALNRADTLQRRGHYPPPAGASSILGLEMAGTVEEVGPGVTRWEPGDRVCALLSGGGYAEYAVAHEAMLMPIPEGYTFEEAAAVPEVFLTAYQALYWLGEMEAGHHVLVHAGASGVGTAALQLVRRAGATAYATASASKHDVCRTYGAEVVVDYRTVDFSDAVLEATGGQGVDLILDFVGAPYFDKDVRALATDGRIVYLAMLGGAVVKEVDLRKPFAKRAQLLFTTLRSRSDAYKQRLTRAFADEALDAFAEGTLRPVVDRVYDWGEVAEAHRRMEANENAGKLVLRVRG